MSEQNAVPRSTSDRLADARALVAAALPPEDTAELAVAADDDDLRDLGLDSIRLIGLADGLRARGADVDLAELAAEPTVGRIARILATLPTATTRPQEVSA